MSVSPALKKAQDKYNKTKKGKERQKKYDKKRIDVALDGIQPDVKERFINAKMGREISHNDFIVELLNKAGL
jgi:folate-binding Fe-S cluster repair protein YgfZ